MRSRHTVVYRQPVTKRSINQNNTTFWTPADTNHPGKSVVDVDLDSRALILREKVCWRGNYHDYGVVNEKGATSGNGDFEKVHKISFYYILIKAYFVLVLQSMPQLLNDFLLRQYALGDRVWTGDYTLT